MRHAGFQEPLTSSKVHTSFPAQPLLNALQRIKNTRHLDNHGGQNNEALNTSNENSAMKYGAAAIFSAIGVAGSVVSMVRTDPSGWLVTMTMSSYFCLLLVYFGDRLQSFSLRDMAAKLQKLETKAASSGEIAKKTAELALKTMRAARDSDYPYSSSGSSSSSSWEEAEESADELTQIIITEPPDGNGDRSAN